MFFIYLMSEESEQRLNLENWTKSYISYIIVESWGGGDNDGYLSQKLLPLITIESSRILFSTFLSKIFKVARKRIEKTEPGPFSITLFELSDPLVEITVEVEGLKRHHRAYMIARFFIFIDDKKHNGGAAFKRGMNLYTL